MKRAAFFLLLGAALLGCPKNNAPTDAAVSAAPTLPPNAAAPARSPEVDDLWERAKDEDAGVPDDLARLARREGVAGLTERGAHPSWRLTAARALGYTEGFAALPWLAEVGSGPTGPDGASPEAQAALDSAVMLAAQVRRPVDPEDAEELRAGCDRLLQIAKDAQKPRRARVAAIRAVRMLSDKGCAKPEDLPKELDAR